MAKQDFTLGKGLGLNNPSRLAANISSIYGGRTLQVSPEQVVPNPLNPYDISDIEELADVIALYGLLQPFVVKGPFWDGTYMLIGGERRWTAVKMIREQYSEDIAKKFDKVEIKVVGSSDMDFIDEQVLIIELNEQGRDMSKYRVQDVWELHRLYKEKQKRGDHMPKNIIKRISEKMGIGQRQVQKYVAVSDKMIPEMKEEVGKSVIGEEGKGKKIISINKAAAIAQLPKEKQEKVHEIIKKQGYVDMETINEIKQQQDAVPFKQDNCKKDILADKSADKMKKAEVQLDESHVSNDTLVQNEEMSHEMELIADVLTWLNELNKTKKLSEYQKNAVLQMKVLVDSILVD